MKRKRESQYVDQYLDANGPAAECRGVTIGTFISKQVQGRAKMYAFKYMTALQAALMRRQQTGEAVLGCSANGAIAWYWADATTTATNEEEGI